MLRTILVREMLRNDARPMPGEAGQQMTGDTPPAGRGQN
jgi:hypothetical protein